MGVFNSSNLKKSIYYLKRNGLIKTVNAVRERLDHAKEPAYCRSSLSEAERKRQSEHAGSGFSDVCFSIVVPAYHTPEPYLREMISSVIKQTYPMWELILVDATEGVEVKRIADTYGDARIRYHHLSSNGGISENTNQGIVLAKGDYVGLLDHDDMLEENALYEMALRIEQERVKGIVLQMLYSDEDKCNSTGDRYYDPNYKENFNLDLILSNNYICHFLVIKRELIQTLGLRKKFDGAQDFDLVLRTVHRILTEGEEKEIAHISSVLYHWRCHTDSTAENPQSKLYAYDAGRRAVQDFVDRLGWEAKVIETEHLGFYRLKYMKNIFETRPELGALGGTVVQKKKIVGGRLSVDGKAFYEGLPISYSGYLHRAVLQQEAEALDIRNIEVKKELWSLFEQVVGAAYVTLPGTNIFDAAGLPSETDFAALSVKLGAALRMRGYKLLYLPERKRISASGMKRK